MVGEAVVGQHGEVVRVAGGEPVALARRRRPARAAPTRTSRSRRGALGLGRRGGRAPQRSRPGNGHGATGASSHSARSAGAHAHGGGSHRTQPTDSPYSRWDGSQVGFELDADDIFEEITDDLLYHGDLNAALRRMMQSGLRGPQRRAHPGHPRDAREAARASAATSSSSYDLGGVYDDIAQELRDVVDIERDVARRAGRPRPASRGDPRRQEITEQVVQRAPAAARHAVARPGRQVKDLQNYEFTSAEAREQFEELLDKLRQQLMQSYVNQMSGAMSNMSPEHMAAHEGHAVRAQPDARAAPARRGARLRRRSWSASATSSPRTRRTSTSCSRSWPSAWRPCRRCSTR